MNKYGHWPLLFGLITGHIASPVVADGLAVDKIYAPYVHRFEKELEYRVSRAQGGLQAPNGVVVQRFGFASALSDNFALEGYLVGRGDDDASSLSGYELEARWQLSEQGEYHLDWGAALEYERSRDDDVEEFAAKLIALREWNRYVFTANGSLIYENSEITGKEYETSFSLQARYRYRQSVEPALELYLAQDYRGIGPALVGYFRLAVKNSLRWELGSVMGLDETSADFTLRFMLEYEFY
jgi:hypothetical protein